jgi:hypothetical protein
MATMRINSQELIAVSTNTKQQQRKQTHGQKEKQIRKELNHFRLFKFKHKFLKLFIDLQTALAAEAHLAEGQ